MQGQILQFMTTGGIHLMSHEITHSNNYRTRQIQNVEATGLDKCVSSDHTFATAKNFRKETGIPNPEKEF